jgi:hypothetical protein
MPQVVAHRRERRLVRAGASHASAVQCGVARRSFSAVAGLHSSITSAAAAKKRFIAAHNRAVVMPGSPSSLPTNAMAGSHFAGVVGTPRWARYRSSAARANGGNATLARFSAVADHVQPSMAMSIDLDRAERGADQLAGAQSRGVGELEHEAQALRGRPLPAMPSVALMHFCADDAADDRSEAKMDRQRNEQRLPSMVPHENCSRSIDQLPASDTRFVPLRGAQDTLQLCCRLADITGRHAIDAFEQGSAAWASASSMALNQLAQYRGLSLVPSPPAVGPLLPHQALGLMHAACSEWMTAYRRLWPKAAR